MEEITLDPEWKLPNQKEEIAHRYHLKKIQELQLMVDRSKLRGKRKVTRFFIDNEYIENGYEAKLPKLCTLVYQGLLYHGNTETQTAWPSFKTLIKHTGEKNRNYISNALRLLKECGIIGVVQCKKGFKTLNLYSFQATDYWISLDHITKRLKLTDSLAQYPIVTLRSIKRRGVRRKNVDTLTNQINNNPNSVTSIGDVLKRQMHKWDKSPGVAIQQGSRNTVVRTAYEGDVEISEPHSEVPDTPDKKGEKTAIRSIQEDTTQFPEIAGKLREEHIELDTTQLPQNELTLEDISKEDIGLGNATL
jgi:hypothetical protein